MRVVLTLIWWLNRLKSILMAFKSLWRPLKARKKGLKNDDMTSFSNSFYDSEFPRIDASKKTIFYGKICIKKSLEIEKTQVVCCGYIIILCWIVRRSFFKFCDLLTISEHYHNHKNADVSRNENNEALSERISTHCSMLRYVCSSLFCGLFFLRT